MSLSELEIEKYKLLGSFRDFTEVFYYLRTDRKFIISDPIGRESHHLIIMRELVKVLRGEETRLIINVPPRYSKTELLIHFIAWGLAHYPDSNFIYVSYSHSLAKKQTQTIKQIIEMPHFRNTFGVYLKDDVQAKDNFETTANGSVYAVGSQGTITGRGAGIQGVNRFGGIICLDDLLKPDEATSDTIREGINEWYFNTLQSRLNSPKTPIILIGQRLHEDDICARLIKTGEWKSIIIPAIDPAGNALNPTMHDMRALLKMKEESPYNFASQYQQDPQPAGGGIFKPEWFKVLDDEPKILSTFITCDTAETEKEWNDATVFSFWGIYKVRIGDIDSDIYALHWLDCVELRVEPKDLKTEFFNFYSNCLKYRVKPSLAAIEKKSTGTTLISELKQYQGLQVYEIERTRAQGSKISRFLEIQPYVARRLVSFSDSYKHMPMCIEHMRKITANNSHRFDDIADTLVDGIKLGLIDKIIINRSIEKQDHEETGKQIYSLTAKVDKLKKAAYGR